MSGGLPTSPFEVESTKDIIQKHIDAGDIKQSDLDLLKRTYRWMSIASVVGSAGMGLPTYFYLRNARPVRPIGVRLMVAGGMGMIGSFLGFTAGGVAAALEVNRRMENPEEKMQIFHEIAIEARQATIDRAIAGGAAAPGAGQRQRPIPGNPRSPLPSSSTASGSTSAYGDAPDSQSFDMASSSAPLGSDGFPSSASSSSSSSSSSSPTRNERDAGSTAWDRLRKDAFPSAPAAPSTSTSTTPGSGAPRPRSAVPSATGQAEREFGASRAGDVGASAGGKDGSDERRREQAEFDALLEKERQGGGDKWA